ncbi:hypothetical protein L596_029489 [Steinernema carpocapsae]|uniref:Uncharacterized protein n=1 Tax=Steinernema carpocapsae TaxID=34508 RepID=A0A4U5LUT6_STECR|nr:hypothetical protein L596_029489 [Steinernema carpocapsae]
MRSLWVLLFLLSVASSQRLCSLYQMTESTYFVFSKHGYVCVRPGQYRSICRMNRMITEDLRTLKMENKDDWSAVKVLRVNETKLLVLRYDGTRRDDVKWTSVDVRETRCPGRHTYPTFSTKFGSTHEPILYDEPKTERFKDHYNGPLCVPKYTKLSSDGKRFVIADIEYDYTNQWRYVQGEPKAFKHLPFPTNCSEWPDYNKQNMIRYNLRNVGKDRICQQWVDDNKIDFGTYDGAIPNSEDTYEYTSFDNLHIQKRGTIYGTLYDHNMIQNVPLEFEKGQRGYQANFMSLKPSAKQRILEAVKANGKAQITAEMYDTCRLRQFRSRDYGELPTSVLIEH